MSLGDSLTPDRALGQQQDRTASEPAVTLTPTERLFARADTAVNGEFEGIYGAGGPEARAALEGAAATEGRAAYTRFRAEPDAFGTVVGNRERADMVGGALEALNHSKAIHAAEQSGLSPAAPGYGAAIQELNQTIGLQDGIYLDGKGNQIGHLGTGSTRLFVVTNGDDVRTMAAAQSTGAGTEPLRNQIGSALEIPSLDAFRVIHADITSQDWATHEVSGLWGLNEAGSSMTAPGGIGPAIQPWEPSSTKAHAVPTVQRDATSIPPGQALGRAGYSFQGTYHSHPDRIGRDNVSNIEKTDRDPGGDRQLAERDDGNISIGRSGSGRSVNVLMNPERNGQTVIYTSSGDVMTVPTESLVQWRSSNNTLIK